MSKSLSAADIRHVLGDLDDGQVAEILALKPTLTDLEDAAVCLAGDQDVPANSGHHVSPIADLIIEMLEPAEEEEPQKR